MHKSPICDWLFCTDPSMQLTTATWMIIVGYKVLHFINNEDYEALGYKILWHTNAVTSHKASMSSRSLYPCLMALKNKPYICLGLWENKF